MKKIGLFLLLSITWLVGYAQYPKTDQALINNGNTVIGGVNGQNTNVRIGNDFLDLAYSKLSVIPLSVIGTNTYVATSSIVTSYSNAIFECVFQNGNTGSATLNINSLGAVNLQKLVSGVYTSLASGDIQNNQALKIWYDQPNNTFQIFLGGAGGTWGSITGTLSNQTDLQNALNAKQNNLTLTTTGSSGAATLVGSTLNIPQYSGSVTNSAVNNEIPKSDGTNIVSSGLFSTTLGNISSGNGTASINSSGGLTLKTGDAYNLAGNGDSGDITLSTGTPHGIGVRGNINFDAQDVKLNITGSGTVHIGNTTGSTTISNPTGFYFDDGAGTLNITDNIITPTLSIGISSSANYSFLATDVSSFTLENSISGSNATLSTVNDLIYVVGSNTGKVPLTLTGVASLDFPNTTTGVSDLTITVTGAVSGNPCFVSPAPGSVTSTATYWCWVSSANTVTVRFSPKSTGGENPASGSFTVYVQQ